MTKFLTWFHYFILLWGTIFWHSMAGKYFMICKLLQWKVLDKMYFSEKDFNWKKTYAMILTNNTNWFSSQLFACGKAKLGSLEIGHLYHLFITTLMSDLYATWTLRGSLNLAKCPGSLNWQPTVLNVTPEPTDTFVIVSIICDKVAEEWGEVFQELGKRGRSFWNNVNLSMLLSQHLNWKPDLSCSTVLISFGTLFRKKNIIIAFKILK